MGKVSHPGFDPIALDVHDLYIVNDHGAELKGQGPTIYWLCYFLDLICHRWYIGACGIYYVGHHVNMHL